MRPKLKFRPAERFGWQFGRSLFNFARERRKGVPGEGVSRQKILETEMLALLVTLVLWKNIVRGASVVFLIDDNSAREITISGVQDTEPVAGGIPVL